MSRTYACDDCGKVMNGDRASDDDHWITVKSETHREILRGNVTCDDREIYNPPRDICWSCLAKRLIHAAEVAQRNAREAAEHAAETEAQ